MKKGNISVQTENIFPIIKKFLYSDHEIFLRELISNAVDATSKLKTLAARGEAKGELGSLTIQVEIDKEAKTITIRDRGIGMNQTEVKKYLNQVAFSSAQSFLEKYKDDANIIGHFGLGFYSAFMVASKVEVRTLSYKPNSKGVTWICEGDPEYFIDANDKAERGTEVILYIAEDSEEFLEDSRIEGLLKKYCRFLPVEIQFGTRKETYTVEPEEGEEVAEDQEKETKEIEVPNIINNPNPIWKKQPNELSDEDYRNFYNELHPFSPAPMFWIHLNIDYPFNLTGILYFPKLGNALEMQRNKIQLYANQVYVTDEVKEIVPEFLTLLHGVIDSPDIPLNVSRSYLQSDANVKKITGYITRKVADKLNELFKNDRKAFEEKWDDLGLFVRYGMISEEKFYEKAQKFALVKNTENEFFTLEEYREKIKVKQTDKYDKLIGLYTNDAEGQDAAISAAKARDYDVLLMNTVVDTHFMQQLEYKEEKLTFVRVDSDTVDNLVQKDETRDSVLSEDEQEQVKTLFSSIAGTGAQVEAKALTPEDQPIVITRPEFMRRMREMQAMQGMGLDGLPDSYNVIVNTNHPLVAQKLVKEENEEQRKEVAEYLLNLAKIGQGMLKGSALTKFVNQSLDFLK